MPDDPVLRWMIYIITFFVAVFIIRAIFSVPKIVRNLRAQTRLLSLMAKKQGCDEKEIDEIFELAEEKEVSIPTVKQPIL